MESLSTKNNFSYLAVSLIFLLFVSANIDQIPGDYGQRIIQAVTVISLLVSLLSFKMQGSWFRVGLVFVVLLVAIVITGYLLDVAGLHFVHILIMLGFYVATTYLAARQVLFTGSIDGNKIVGSICIYLLMGLIWALLYLLIIEFETNAFNGMTGVSWHKNFPVAVYFSFATLTTLGYGDIIPVLPLARFFVFMEAIVGVFYMAILVASLIGVRMSEIHRNPKDQVKK